MTTTTINHKIRHPEDDEYWLIDWTATVNNEKEENNYNYIITPSKNWRFPANQIVYSGDSGTGGNGTIPISNIYAGEGENIVVTANSFNPSSGWTGIPILNNNKKVINGIAFNNNASSFLNGNGVWTQLKVTSNQQILINNSDNADFSKTSITISGDTLTLPTQVLTGYTLATIPASSLTVGPVT